MFTYFIATYKTAMQAVNNTNFIFSTKRKVVGSLLSQEEYSLDVQNKAPNKGNSVQPR